MDEKLPLHIVIAKAWILKEGKILFGKRDANEAHEPNVWGIPGGKVEIKEEINILENTLKEEIMEEVGLEVENLRYFYSNSFTRSTGHNVVNLSFVCDYKSGNEQPLEDTVELKWVALDEVENWVELPKYLKDEVISLRKFLQV